MTPRLSSALLRTQSDRRLLVLAADGHAVAFEVLAERYRRELWRHCRRLVDDAQAEDAVQQALLHAWTAVRAGADVAEARAWLHRIAHNAAIDMLRRGPARQTELSAQLAARGDPHEDFESRAMLRQTLGGVAALPDRQRLALLGTVVDGREQRDLARELGVSHGALRQLVHAARTTLRSAVTALTPAPVTTWFARAATDGESILRSGAGLAGGVGSAGLAGTLTKVGAVAVVAGGVVGAAPSLIAAPPVTPARTARPLARASARPMVRTPSTVSSPSTPPRRGARPAAPARPTPPPLPVRFVTERPAETPRASPPPPAPSPVPSAPASWGPRPPVRPAPGDGPKPGPRPSRPLGQPPPRPPRDKGSAPPTAQAAAHPEGSKPRPAMVRPPAGPGMRPEDEGRGRIPRPLPPGPIRWRRPPPQPGEAPPYVNRTAPSAHPSQTQSRPAPPTPPRGRAMPYPAPAPPAPRVAPKP